MTKLMPKSNPSRHVLLVLTKIIWKNTGTFWGIGGETAAALFAILQYYQRTFCASYSQPRVYGVNNAGF